MIGSDRMYCRLLCVNRVLVRHIQSRVSQEGDQSALYSVPNVLRPGLGLHNSGLIRRRGEPAGGRLLSSQQPVAVGGFPRVGTTNSGGGCDAPEAVKAAHFRRLLRPLLLNSRPRVTSARLGFPRLRPGLEVQMCFS